MFDGPRAEDSPVGVFRKRVVTVEGAEVANPYIVPPHEKFGNPFGKRDRASGPSHRTVRHDAVKPSAIPASITVQAHIVYEKATTMFPQIVYFVCLALFRRQRGKSPMSR